MPYMTQLRLLEQIANRSLADIAAELEALATKALWKLAKSHPKSEVRFCSAMGTVYFDIVSESPEGRKSYQDAHPPVLQTFERVWLAFGNNAIPAPIFLTIKDGKLTRLTDW